MNYIVIQGWMCNKLELKGNDLLVYAMIYGFSQDGETRFRAGRKYISETFNISLPTVDKSLQNLINKQYIIKHDTNDFIHPNEYEINIEVVKKLYEGSKETLLGGSKETLHNNINNTKVLFTNNTKKEKDNKDNSQKVMDLYHTICVSLPKVIKPTEKRRKGIQALIKKGYTINDFREAFELAEQSDFLTGKNDRGWKANFDFFLREDKFVKILEGDYGGRKRNITDREGMSKAVERYTQEEKQQIRKGLKDGKYERI